MSTPLYMTRATECKLRAKLDRLQKEELPAMSAELAQTAAYGDIHDNFEWQAAKDRLKQIVDEIELLKDKIRRRVLIEDLNVPGDRVTIGVHVTVMDLVTGEETTYTILGSEEADPKRQVLSTHAPFIRPFMGKRAGEVIQVVTAAGKKSFEVLKIEKVFT